MRRERASAPKHRCLDSEPRRRKELGQSLPMARTLVLPSGGEFPLEMSLSQNEQRLYRSEMTRKPFRIDLANLF